MYLLPFPPPFPPPPSPMSSHPDPYPYSSPSPVHHESNSESPVTRQPEPFTQSWQPTATIDHQSGYSQTDQLVNVVRNSSEVYETEYMTFSPNFPGHDYAIPSVPSQDQYVGPDATHFDDGPFVVNPQLYTHLAFNDGQTLDPHPYNLYNQFRDGSSMQPFVHNLPQHTAQGIYTSQPSQGSFASVSLCSSPQVHPLSDGGPLYGTETGGAHLTPGSLVQEGVDTARTDAGASQHSRLSPVATSPTNQNPAAGPSHQPPSSPDRKRSLPLTADEQLPTARRVVRRHDGASSVHSSSPGSHRRSHSYPDVHGRGPLIPQERYRANTISYNQSVQPNNIAFNLQNPDQIGIPITDILNKTDAFAHILNGGETFNMQKKTFTLRVLWPGYKAWSKTIAALDWKKLRGPVTRVKLAEAVATAIQDLFEQYYDKPYDPDYARWNVGPNGVRLDQICLLALHPVSKGSWQPQLCLLAPHH